MFGLGSRLSHDPFPWLASDVRALQGKEIKGAILVFVTNKMVMGFPSGCYFSWSPLLWSFGFL